MKKQFRVEARRQNLRTIREFIAETCVAAGGEAALCFDLKSAVDEACTNIIEHGYREEPGPIEISFEEDGDRLVVMITDWGGSFSPADVREPDLSASWKERSTGGLGWHLIRRMVDEVDYASGGARGNRLVLVKRRRPRERT
jgi:serine/threonine-protein kinase RsbW